jgi:hypothetical protein
MSSGPANLFQLEMAEIWADKKKVMLRLSLTLLIGCPFILFEMPLQVQLAGLSMVLIFSCFFGSAVALGRRHSEGRIDRLKIMALSRWSIYGDTLLARSILDFLRIGILLILFLLFRGNLPTFSFVITVAGALLATVLVYSIMGSFLGTFLRNNPEIHLFGALGCALLGAASGVLPLPTRLLIIVDTLNPWNPLSHLLTKLEEIIRNGCVMATPRDVFSILLLATAAGVILLRSLNINPFLLRMQFKRGKT